MTVIPNGREVSAFPFVDADERLRARERLDIPPECEVFLSLGALSPEKRVDLAVQAMAHLPGLLLVAGDGDERPALEALAANVADGRVRFLGQVADAPALLAAGDVLLLTSDSEGLPGVLIEAGLTGLPVVATDVGYVRDIVEDGVTGFVVMPGDVTGVARAGAAALAGREVLGAAARERCLKHFDMAKVADLWEALLVSCVSDGDGSSDRGA